MSTAKNIRPGTLTRRDTLKASGLALGGAALGAASSQEAAAGVPGIYSGISPSEKNTFFSSLKPYYPGEETLEADEMRITFLGTSCIPRLVQACNSVFVELGNGDSFVFDCGTGVIVKYYAMKIGMEKIDRIFLTHLHADHMGDVAFVYGFGPSVNRRWPLYIWGPSRSGLEYPKSYADGTADFCYHLQEMMRWHNESQSFLPSGYVPDGKEPPYDLPDMTCLGEGGGTDAYDLMYKELDWRLNPGVAYDHNGVKIWHFPAVHCRAGSVCYKLEWNGLSMAFSGDNKPNRYMIDNASGVDVLIHEIVVPTDVWVEKGLGVPRDSPYWDKAYAGAKDVQDSSHTPQKAYGYLLDQMAVPPRLAIGTHFQASDDTIRAAMTDIRKWYSKGEVIIANDLMVINVTKRKITKRRAIVSSYTWQPPTIFRSRALAPAKYPNSTFQLDPEGLAHCIPPAVIDQKG